jgi:hypothetical protein
MEQQTLKTIFQGATLSTEKAVSLLVQHCV